MGVCMEVLIVDWSWLRPQPADRRGELVEVAAFGPEDAYDYDLPEGWTWPEGAEDRWWARYEFRSTMTSYKAHFWAGERWDKLRDFVDPPLREALDQFGAPLFWGEHHHELLPPDQPPFSAAVVSHPDDWHREAGVMLWLRPEDVEVLRRFWAQAEPHLSSLRDPFERHLPELTGWIADFDSFARLVTEWGDVVSRAAEREWAVIGLRC
ncbi:hypothetical protein H9Y04_10265 [Streptomyces sp. TRM66268-LWL]|uniref:Uncharacterized protein n=1 Tax=Streptomyces polyasparticus TaxID=2767826 RepID=A0ABR7SDC5_9ACTN|nr:hypothetical protein [Streptomyces polyasparticus]MBC9712952.1 hypothetical protein [Streptomyces polyasparticus]